MDPTAATSGHGADSPLDVGAFDRSGLRTVPLRAPVRRSSRPLRLARTATNTMSLRKGFPIRGDGGSRHDARTELLPRRNSQVRPPFCGLRGVARISVRPIRGRWHLYS